MILRPLSRLNGKVKVQWCLSLGGGVNAWGTNVRFPIIYGGNCSRALVPLYVVGKKSQHTDSCPTANKRPGARGGGGGSRPDEGDVPGKRRIYGGKCRIGFIPEDYFKFFQPQTGVSGGYLFLLTFINYCVSKEIYVMEHEYYTGLSIALMLWYISTRFGPQIGAALDKDVDAFIEEWEKGRNTDRATYQRIVDDATQAQKRAEGQALLMSAKKENVAMQLEAIYRERAMHVYKMVKGRMDYHLRRHQSEARIHQKWMYQWVMNNVMQSITPDFEKAALNQAIKDIESMASRA